ncbi:MAG: fibronectin type III domain-containing protein, partial [Clostridia bacterium]
MKKRLLSWALVTAMAISMIPTTVFADDFDYYQVDSLNEVVADGDDLSENDLYVQNEDGSYTYVYDLDYGDEIDWAYIETDDGGVMAVERQLLTSDMIEINYSSTTTTNEFGLDTTAPNVNGEDPYGITNGSVANLTPTYELLVDDSRQSSAYGNLYNYDIFTGSTSNYINTLLYDSYYQEGINAITGTDVYSRVQAFDAEGTGSRNWVARLVCSKNGSDYYIQFYQIINGVMILEYTDNLGDIGNLSNIKTWEAGSYLSLAAGDFDGNGTEEIAMTTYGDTVYGQIRIYSYDKASLYKFPYETPIDLYDYNVLNSKYTEDDDKASRFGYQVVSLTAGTLYGNIADDLVISISTNNTEILSAGDATAKVVVFAGDDIESGKATKEITYNSINNQSQRHARNMATTIGDIDNDGIADLVIACESSWNENQYIDPKSGDDDMQFIRNYITAYTLSNGDIVNKTSATNIWSAHTSVEQQYYKSDIGGEPVALVAFAYAGMYEKDYVYLEGNTFEWNVSTNVFDWTNDSARAITNYDVKSYTNKWVSQAIAGNVTNDATGVESVYQVWGAKADDDEVYTFGTSWLHYDVEDSSWSSKSKTFSNGASGTTSMSITMPDYDDDGIYVEYQDTDYYFTEPVISAVLQASPRFSELDELDGNYSTNGGTSIGSSQSSSSSTSNGLSISSGISLGFEYDMSVLGLVPIGGGSVTATVDANFSSSWEKETEITTSITYSSESDNDRVVVTMVPYTRYKYLMSVPETTIPTKAEYDSYVKAYDPNDTSDENLVLYDLISSTETAIAQGYDYGETITDMPSWQNYVIDIPSEARTTIMTVDSYDKVAESMGWDTIRGNVLPSNYEIGNPDSYITSTSSLDNWSPASSVDLSVGTGGGSTEVSLEGSETSTTSIGYGVEVSMEIGTSLTGITTSRTAGIGYEGGSSWSNTTGVAYTGSVQGLPTGSEGYGFDWNFGTYTVPFSNEQIDYDCLVLGYILNDVTAPPSLPTDFEITGTETDSLTLSWTAGTRPPKYYVIYIYANGEYYIEATLDSSTTEYVSSNLESDTEYQYAIVSKNDTSSSVYSSVISGTTLKEGSSGFDVVIQEDITVNSGDSATFEASVEYDDDTAFGNTPASYRWYQKVGGSWVAVSTSGSTYTVSNPTLDMDGTEYRCIVSQLTNTKIAVSDVSNTATLYVGKVDTTTELTALNGDDNYGQANYSETEMVDGEVTYDLPIYTVLGEVTDDDVIITEGTTYYVYSYGNDYYLVGDAIYKVTSGSADYSAIEDLVESTDTSTNTSSFTATDNYSTAIGSSTVIEYTIDGSAYSIANDTDLFTIVGDKEIEIATDDGTATYSQYSQYVISGDTQIIAVSSQYAESGDVDNETDDSDSDSSSGSTGNEQSYTTKYYLYDDGKYTELSLGTEYEDGFDLANVTAVTMEYTPQVSVTTTVAGDDVTLTATVSRDDDEDVESSTVKFTIVNTTTNATTTITLGEDGETIKTGGNGVATATWLPTAAGVYEITAVYSTSSLENASTSNTATYYVYAAEQADEASFLSVSGATTMSYGDTETYTVKIYDGTGAETNITDDSTVIFKVNGVEVTDDDSTLDATYSFKPTAPGTYTILATYTDSDDKTSMASTNVTVGKKDITITAPSREIAWNGLDNTNTDVTVTETDYSDVTITDGTEGYTFSETYGINDIYYIYYKLSEAMGDYTINFGINADSITDGKYTDFTSKYSPTLVSGTYEVTGTVYKVDYSADTNGTLIAKYGTDNIYIQTGNNVLENNKVTFTATPETGYTIEKWVINGNEYRNTDDNTFYTEKTYVINQVGVDDYLTSDDDVEYYQVEVYFAAAEYKLSNTTDTNANGTVTAKYYNATTNTETSTFTFGGNLFAGDQVRVTATPADGYVVSSWEISTDDGETYKTILALDGTSDYTETAYLFAGLSGDTSVKVNFAKQEEATVIVKVLNGTSTVSGMSIYFGDTLATYDETAGGYV